MTGPTQALGAGRYQTGRHHGHQEVRGWGGQTCGGGWQSGLQVNTLNAAWYTYLVNVLEEGGENEENEKVWFEL